MNVPDLEAPISVKTLVGLDPGDALNHLAELFDAARDLRREDGLHKGIALAQELLASGLRADQEVRLHYFVGKAWASVRYIRRSTDERPTGMRQGLAKSAFAVVFASLASIERFAAVAREQAREVEAAARRRAAERYAEVAMKETLAQPSEISAETPTRDAPGAAT